MSPKKLRNLLLLFASVLFYSWGEGILIIVMFTTIIVDFFAGLAIANNGIKKIFQTPATLRSTEPRSRFQKFALIASITVNLGLLGFFKYANFGLENVRQILDVVGLHSPDFFSTVSIMLPLGISFYTFQSMSYTIDVYRGHTQATRQPINFACFVTLFPQLIAGPIVRYADIARELVFRVVDRKGFASGIRRFTIGLAKKVLIANVVAVPADAIFALTLNELTTPLAWLGLVSYSLQIYFDFSGYSDMAIGLGRMFGFHFLENFNYPYIATSIKDFWRRWHISLSTWFRDYLYIPLGGNRRGTSRTYLHLITVFFLVGLWHGANWTFVAWGLFHGFFLVIERTTFGKRLERIWVPFRHLYVLVVVVMGWVLFRSESFAFAAGYYRSLFGFAQASEGPTSFALLITAKIVLAMILGIIGSAPVSALWRFIQQKIYATTRPNVVSHIATAAVDVVFIVSLFVLSSMQLASGTHNPFIYFRF